MVTKPDRLARSTAELLASEADLSRRGVGLVVLSMGGEGTAWRLGVSGRNCCLRKWIVSRIESLPKAGTERAIVDSATNLQQQIGPSSRPTHLLRFVHPTVHQKIGRPFGDGGADPQSGPVPLGII